MKLRTVFLTPQIFFLSIVFSAQAQETQSKLTRPKGLYISGYYTSVADPFFKQPSGNDELSVSQSTSSFGFNVSYLYLDDDFGGGLGITYWSTKFNSFQVPVQEGSSNFVAYKGPSLSLFFVDLQLHILPWKIPLSFYGVLGLGSGNETYTISGATSPFTSWNGPKDISEFHYSYDLGIQVFLWKFISLQTEIRWVPGQLTTEYRDYLYSKDGYDYFGSSNQKTDNLIKMFSLGLSISGLW